MKNRLMLGLWRFIINVPPILWEKKLPKGKENSKKSMGLYQKNNIIRAYAYRFSEILMDMPFFQLSAKVASALAVHMVRDKLLQGYGRVYPYERRVDV